MSTTAQEFYVQVTRNLPPPERLRLATLILNDLVDRDNPPTIDQGDHWTEDKAGFWLEASQQSLDAVWGNTEDDVYAQLL